MRRPATRRDLALLALAALALLAATAVFTWSRALDDPSSWDVPLYQSFGAGSYTGPSPDATSEGRPKAGSAPGGYSTRKSR